MGIKFLIDWGKIGDIKFIFVHFIIMWIPYTFKYASSNSNSYIHVIHWNQPIVGHINLKKLKKYFTLPIKKCYDSENSSPKRVWVQVAISP